MTTSVLARSDVINDFARRNSSADWYGVWPWAQQALGDAKPDAMPCPEGSRINFELVASFPPDLIIEIYPLGFTQPAPIAEFLVSLLAVAVDGDPTITPTS